MKDNLESRIRVAGTLVESSKAGANFMQSESLGKRMRARDCVCIRRVSRMEQLLLSHARWGRAARIDIAPSLERGVRLNHSRELP